MKVTEEVIRVEGIKVRAMLQRFDSDDLKKLLFYRENCKELTKLDKDFQPRP